MKKNSRIFLVSVCCLLVLLVGCGKKEEEKEVVIDNKQQESTAPVENTTENVAQTVDVVTSSDKVHYNKAFDLRFNIPENMTVATQEELDAVNASSPELKYEFQGTISDLSKFALIQIAYGNNPEYSSGTDEEMVEGLKEGFKAYEGYVGTGDGKIKIGSHDYNYFDMDISQQGVTFKSKALVGRSGNDLITILIM